MLRMNIQLFAEPTKEELDELASKLSGGNQTQQTPQQTPEEIEAARVQAEEQARVAEEQRVAQEAQTALENEAKEKGLTVDELKKQKAEAEEDPEDVKIKNEKGGIKALREKQKADAKRAKELEEEKARLQASHQEVSKNLMRAIKLGIKGETQEEILENLKAHDIKETAEKSGLTEEQVKKENELKEELSKLSEAQKELVFNQRAFNLQKEKNLSNEQLTAFISKASSLGINLLSNVTNFSKIYDEIIVERNQPTTDKALQEEIARLKAENESLKKKSAPGASIPGTTSPTGDFMTDLRGLKGKNEK